MNASSCSSSVAPPKIRMMASDSQLTAETRPRFQCKNAICASDATIAALVAKKMPCHLNATKKRISGKKSAMSCITVHYTPAGVPSARAGPGQLKAGRAPSPTGRCQSAQLVPVERRAGIGLAVRRDVRMSGHVLDRIAASEGLEESREHRVLRALVGDVVGAFELDADRKVVAVGAAAETRHAGVPRPLVAGHELQESSVAAHEKVRGDVQVRDRYKGRMGRRVEPIGEQPQDRVAAEHTRWQRDAVDDDQCDRRVDRSGIMIRGRAL